MIRNKEQLREILLNLQPGEYVAVNMGMTFAASSKANRSLAAMVNSVSNKRRDEGVMLIKSGGLIVAASREAKRRFTYVL